jgi:hypothetical protein
MSREVLTIAVTFISICVIVIGILFSDAAITSAHLLPQRADEQTRLRLPGRRSGPASENNRS